MVPAQFLLEVEVASLLSQKGVGSHLLDYCASCRVSQTPVTRSSQQPYRREPLSTQSAAPSVQNRLRHRFLEQPHPVPCLATAWTSARTTTLYQRLWPRRTSPIQRRQHHYHCCFHCLGVSRHSPLRRAVRPKPRCPGQLHPSVCPMLWLSCSRHVRPAWTPVASSAKTIL